jgi:hypothetical protein
MKIKYQMYIHSCIQILSEKLCVDIKENSNLLFTNVLIKCFCDNNKIIVSKNIASMSIPHSKLITYNIGNRRVFYYTISSSLI